MKIKSPIISSIGLNGTDFILPFGLMKFVSFPISSLTYLLPIIPYVEIFATVSSGNLYLESIDIMTSTVKSSGLSFVSITEPTFTPLTETSDPRVRPPIDAKFVNMLYPEMLFVFAVNIPHIRK